MTNPTPTPSADIHAAGRDIPWLDWPHDQCPFCGADVQVRTSASQNAEGAPYDAQAPFCYVGDQWRCRVGHTGTTFSDGETAISLEGDEDQSDPRDARIAALQSEIAQLRADLATATANAAKAQDTINGQARDLQGLRVAVKRYRKAIETLVEIAGKAYAGQMDGESALRETRAAAEAALKQGGGKDE